MEVGILESNRAYGNLHTLVVGGGVGGARMVRALAEVVSPASLSIVVNVGDDDDLYGVRVCPDLDTVVYTLAGIEGPEGWGVAGDTFTVLDRLAALGVDTTFRLGDTDLANCLMRTQLLALGVPLSAVTERLAAALGVTVRVVPVTDDPIRTRIRTTDGVWLSFQEYFVLRHHADRVAEVVFAGAVDAAIAPGVADLVAGADLIVIAPSNPVLSIAPMLAVAGFADAIAAHPRVVAVSPFFSGRALKGPAAEVLDSLGLPAGNLGVLDAYRGLLTHLVIDEGDAATVGELDAAGVAIHVAPTRLTRPDRGAPLAIRLLDIGSTG